MRGKIAFFEKSELLTASAAIDTALECLSCLTGWKLDFSGNGLRKIGKSRLEQTAERFCTSREKIVCSSWLSWLGKKLVESYLDRRVSEFRNVVKTY